MRNALLTAALLGGLFLVPPAAGSQHTPQEALESLRIGEGLEIRLWASEPDVINPTNMDVDERGRIWVTEAVNYRRTLRGEPDYREQGDRITILEDSDRDGRADRVKVFLQDPSLRSPLGIAVLGNRVFVSQSPHILVYTKDEQDRILRREVFLTGWGGEDHDHGVHAIVFGPDGYYYFNNGDQGLDVTDRSGRRIVSGPDQPYSAGSALRVRPDGTSLEVLGHNFRNPYELAVDSFGNIWQTDNDDDGNAWVRLNYVLEGGNHGYWGPGGRRWREDRGTHFHEEDPGVVPTLLRTGAGSPCGIALYEGDLWPARYRGALLHADAGPRVLRVFHVRPQGAGFQAEMEDLVDGQDTWFRPSDVVVAPDGSVFVADWYDAVVGGHQMKDTQRGRIYRIAPPGHRPRVPDLDLSSPQGRAAALASPAQSVRYLAHQEYRRRGEEAVEELQAFLVDPDPVFRARALWLLGASGPSGLTGVREQLQSDEPAFRLLAVRILKEFDPDFPASVRPLLQDPSPQVRRQIAVSLRDQEGEEIVQDLAVLAAGYDGQDRWYLEALAIGARGKENRLYRELRRRFPSWDSRLARLLWVLRPSEAVDYLRSVALDPGRSLQERQEAIQALGAQPSPEVGKWLARLVQENHPEPLREEAARRLIKQLFSQWIPLRSAPEIVSALQAALRIPSVQPAALDLVGEVQDVRYRSRVLELAGSVSLPVAVRAQAVEVTGRLGGEAELELLRRLLDDPSPELQQAAVRGLGGVDQEVALDLLTELVLSERPNELRSAALRSLGNSPAGLHRILDLAERNRLPAELYPTAVLVVQSSRRPEIAERAERHLPMFTTRTQETLQNPRAFLLRVQGRPGAGKEVFHNQGQCATCHNVGGGPEKIGPDLAGIGDKMGAEGLLESILNPSAGIAPEYVTWILKTRREGEVRGMRVADTPQEVVLLDLLGNRKSYPPAEILERRRDPVSAMPPLVGLLTEQELADLIAYLQTLRAGGD